VSTLAHEVTHASGHVDRLAVRRCATITRNAAFGRARNWSPYLDSLRRPQHCSKVGDGRPR
jgi:hypothetical protein